MRSVVGVLVEIRNKLFENLNYETSRFVATIKKKRVLVVRLTYKIRHTCIRRLIFNFRGQIEY